MRFLHKVVAAATGLALGMPALAADQGLPVQPGVPGYSQALFKGAISETDVSLLFAYLKTVLIAAAEGREVPVPEALNQRAEALGQELKAHGTLAGLVLLNVLEAQARQMLRELENPDQSVLPPSVPYTPTRN